MFEPALDLDELSIVRDIRELARGIEKSVTVVEKVPDMGEPFEQKAHSLMTESVDRIVQQWVGELNGVRENTKTVEAMVITQATKVKEELTKLHLLGVRAMREAQRGREVAQHLADEIDAMMG